MRVYIAGPYTAPSAEEVHRNVARAMEVARQVYLKRHIPVVPHLTHFLHLDWVAKGTWAPYKFWMVNAAATLEDCDAILMIENWQNSEGAKKEFDWAQELDMPTYFTVEDLPDGD